MRRILFIPLFIILLTLYLHSFGNEKITPVNTSKVYYNYILNIGLEGYLDTWMQTTYGLTPVLGFEMSTNVSPLLDGVIEISASRKSGTYINRPVIWYGINYFSYDFNFLYGKIGIGLRFCDRRLAKRTPFLETGLDAIQVKEWGEGNSNSSGTIGSHIAMGFWGYIHKNWIILLKGKMQFLSVPVNTDYHNYYLYDSYYIDFSGASISLGIGVSK